MDKFDHKPEKLSNPKKWVPRPLVTVCGVCGSPATDVHHYGATSCYSCRAFFRRSIGSGKDYRYCSRKTDACVVDAVSRTNCKKCRFQKCLQVGMKPEKVDRVRKKNKIIKTEIKEEIIEENHQSDSCTSVETNEFFNFRDSKRSSLDSSHDFCSSIDISALAEECIFEQVKFVDESEYYEKHLSVIRHESNKTLDLKYEVENLFDESGDNLPSIFYR